MNRDLAKYILSLKDEISLRIWLGAVAKSARNGTANLMVRDLLLENRITKPQLDKYFNVTEAEKMEVIKVLVQTDNFISINFRKGTKQEAGSKQLKLAAKADPENQQKLLPQETEPKTEAIAIISETETSKAPKGLLVKIPAAGYTPTQPLIKLLISDYISFFKQLQVDKSALVGRHLEFDNATPPSIQGEDVKHLKELSKYFSKLVGVDTEEKIRKCFHRVYVSWWNLTEFIQNKPELRYIRSNINTIILEIQNTNDGKTSNKREAELNKKLDRAGSKDYSHLARSRKKSD